MSEPRGSATDFIWSHNHSLPRTNRLLLDASFQDMVQKADDGTVVVDFAHFHRVHAASPVNRHRK